MSSTAKLSYTSAMILASIDAGAVYGLSIMELTGLPSGTVYPAMRRLEAAKLITAQWEDERIATRELRPARKYYKLNRAGKEMLVAVRERYPLLQQMKPVPEVQSK